MGGAAFCKTLFNAASNPDRDVYPGPFKKQTKINYMGYHLTTIEDGPLGPYLGSQTLYAAADEGAFDSPVSPEMTQLCENDSRIVAIVEASGVDHCLAALRSSSKRGRDTDLLINEIETNYKKGFKIIQ